MEQEEGQKWEQISDSIVSREIVTSMYLEVLLFMRYFPLVFGMNGHEELELKFTCFLEACFLMKPLP